MSTLSDEIANLSPEKRAALQKLLQNRQAQRKSAPLPRIDAVARDQADYPLSSAEQRLWFLDRFSQTDAAFNLHAALELHGPLDADALAASFRRLIERHETLRTRYVMVDGEPRRMLDAGTDLQMERIDLLGLDADTRDAEVHRRTRAHALQHFSLERGGLLASALLALDTDRHVLLLAMHHIVSDGWSLTLLLDEVWDGYAAVMQGRPPLPPLPVQYLDYAVWQQNELASPRLARQVDYWRRQLDAAPDLLELPTDRARPASQTYAGHELQFHLPHELLQRLKQGGRDANASLFMVTLTAYVALLSRWSGQSDIVVGTDVANRNYSEIEPLIGFFVNQLALRCRFDADTELSELLRHVRGVCLEAFANQDVPFNHLVDRLQIARDPGRTPVFQAKFMLQNTPDARDDDDAALTAIKLERVEDTSQFDVLLALKETADGGARGSLRYRTDLFDIATAERWVAHYLALLDLIVAEPTRALGRIAWLSPDERTMLARLNESGKDLGFRALPCAFADAADEHADASALTCGGTTLTYRELRERSDGLALQLLARGVMPEQPIAVCMARSVDMVIALLAVLRSGACYVPLDPDYGAERLAYVLEDCGARIVLCDDESVELPPHVERLIGDWHTQLPAQTAEWPRPVREQLAYIIYTSGSTGRPKGVAVRHGGLSNFLASMRVETGLQSSDRLLAVTTVAFDIAALELYLPLLCGASILLATREEAQDGRRLHALVREGDLSVLQATPSTWRALLAAACGAPLPLLALCGGEALPKDLAVQLLGAGVRLLNVYGPTETTIWSSLGEVTTEQLRELANAPLGRPLANTTLHVLDREGQPVPVGVPGELCIGGDGLARGYWNKPALTAAAFVPDPFGSSPGARLYRTGDVVRWLSDGRLAFLGRQDHQVKVRGYRIELGEIESVLGTYPGIANAVVVTRPDTLGSALLVAYLQGRDDAIDVDAVLQHAAAFLPQYMLPNEVHWIDRLPLTPNGKVDRKALAQAAAERVTETAATHGSPPSTALELQIADIWQAVLGVGAVQMEQDFFRSGGHSLLAVQLLDRIERACRVELPLQAFFLQPTPAGIVVCVQAQANAGDNASLEHAPIAADPAAASQPFPLTSIQQAYWLGRSGSFELGNIATQNYLEIEIRDFDPPRFTAAWNALVRRHGMLRAVFADDGTQRILAKLPDYAPIVLDLCGCDNAEATLLDLRMQMKSQVLPAATGPLFELRYSRRDETRWRVHFCIDMLISDVVSNHILFGELALLYRDFDAALPALSITFRDYVVAEQALLASPRFECARRYWLDRAPTFPGRPDLPLALDPSRLAEQTFSRRRWTLPAPQWQALKERGQALRVSPTVLMLTVFGEVLGTWSKDPRFALNLTLFNRLPLHVDVDHLVGDFTSSLLLEIEHGPGLGFEQRAIALQARLWQDLDHKLFNGVEMIRELARARGGTQSAAMPVVFTSILGLDTPGQTNDADTVAEKQAEEGYSASQTSQVWLDHQVAEQHGALTLVWDALDAVFPDGMLDAMFTVYTERLRQLADSVESWQRPPTLMPAAQRTRRAAINHVPAPLTDDCLHTLFERQAAAAPNAIAIRTPQTTIDYRTLHRWSDALAAALIDAGAGRDGLVAIVMHKGWEQIVAAMAILKAGSAYMPVDADLPPHRRAQVIDEGGARIALLQADIDFTHDGVRTLVIDAATLDSLPPSAPTAQPIADDLAYVIFTSGSTGKPKGVVIDHRGAVNTILDINRRFDVRAGDAVLALSSLSFDLSVYDIFGLLAVGGTIVLPQQGRLDSAAHWWECIVEGGVTVWNTVPALMQLLVDHCERLQPAGLGPLRVVMMSGDWIPVALPGRIRALSPAASIYSLGGATEASIWSIFHPIDEPTPELRSVPYGRPMSNQSFHVLDAAMEPRPDGVTGMLYIGGIGLAKGYWRDPVRTALSFLAGPGGERRYRTGDLGRYLPDGNIEFLGREDSQVKVQGYRIELGDIEAALQSHPLIGAAAVNAIGEYQDSKTLVAYVVARNANDATDGLITDPHMRSLFKLEQRAVRKSDATFPYTPLQGCRIGALLQGLTPTTVGGQPLPKYRYPSASSLYPVQVYAYVPACEADTWDVAQGFYYHHAGTHSLMRLSDTAPFDASDCKTLQLHLVADLAAIEPLYAVDEARRFCLLEAGYLSAAIGDDASTLGRSMVSRWDVRIVESPLLPARALALGCIELHQAPDVETQPVTPQVDAAINGVLALPEATACVGSYDVLQRQSFRRYTALACTLQQIGTVLELTSLPACDLIVHLQRCDGVAAGWYRYLPQAHALQPLASKVNARGLLNEANAAVFDTSAFALFITGADVPAVLAEVGTAGQRLMSRCWRVGVGVCPVGAVQAPPFLFDEEQQVLHAFVGGVIDAEQCTRWEPDAAPHADLTPEALADYLSERLPGYMVPRIYIGLAALPLSLNGKIDRKALPQPDLRRKDMTDHAPPQTSTERLLAALWEQLLKLERVGRHDAFFALGGNSLVAMQLSSRLRIDHGIELGLRQVFEHPTLADMAAAITPATTAAGTLPGIAIDIHSLRGDWMQRQAADDAQTLFPLSMAQRHLFAHQQRNPAATSYNIPTALQIDGAIDPSALAAALQRVVNRHEALRTRFDYRDGEVWQCIDRCQPVDVAIVDLTGLTPDAAREEALRQIQEDASRPFDLYTGPLLRARVMRMDASVSMLMINVHHIIADYLSMEILVGELGAAYAADTPQQAPLALHFADFALWERAFLASPDAVRQLGYWQHRLRDVPRLELPASTVEPDGWQAFEIDGDLLARMRTRSRELDITVFMLGFAAAHQLMASHCGQDDFAIGTPISTRRVPELEPCVGLLLNTLPIRLAVDRARTGQDLLRDTRMQCIQAFEHSDYPYEGLLASLRQQRPDAFDEVPYRVRYVYRRIDAQTADIAARQPDIRRSQAKFDLLITLNESDDHAFGEIEYRGSAIDADAVSMLCSQMVPLLTWLADSPQHSLDALHALLAQRRNARNETRRQTRSLKLSDRLRKLRR